MQIESDSANPFLNVTIRFTENLPTLNTTLTLNIHIIHDMLKRNYSETSAASTLCQERQDLFTGIDNLICDLKLSGYSERSTDSSFNSRGRSHRERQKNSLDSVSILYVKDISGKFRGVGSRYIRAAFKTKQS